MIGRLYSLFARGYRYGRGLLYSHLGLHNSEETLNADSQRFWERVSTLEREGGDAHWRGNGVFANDERWLAVGHNNLRIFERLAGKHWLSQRPARIVEWGCGGGANAVHFARGAARFYGVDITSASLAECQRQMEASELHHFVQVLFKLSEPEQVLSLIPEPCDLLLSTYVFELIPSKAYGTRVLEVAHGLLAPGGLAFIQIKYSDLSPASQGYRWGYAQNMANMTTYRIEEFWLAAEESGFQPEVLLLEPQQPLVRDRRYAYFLLRRP